MKKYQILCKKKKYLVNKLFHQIKEMIKLV